MNQKFSHLVGIHGNAGAGKDTASDWMVQEIKNYVVGSFSFAENLKGACSQIFGIPFENFSDPATKNVKNSFWNKTPRELAQFVGTELFRKNFGEDIWIKSLEVLLSCYQDIECAIITDVRFQNEADWIIDNGGILLHLTRPGADGKVGIQNHASEAGIKTPQDWYAKGLVWHIDNSGTLEELYRKLDNFLAHRGINTSRNST